MKSPKIICMIVLAAVLGFVAGMIFHPASVKAQAVNKMYMQSLPFRTEQLTNGYQPIGSEIVGFSCTQSKIGEPVCYALTTTK